VRWKSTVTPPTAFLYGRTYASSFWNHTTVCRSNSHSGDCFTLLCVPITSPQPYTSYLYLSHISLLKITRIEKSCVYRYLCDPRRHSCVSTCKTVPVIAVWFNRMWNVSTKFGGSPTSNFMKSHSVVLDLLRVDIRTWDTQS
jgi:hypothetical protein